MTVRYSKAVGRLPSYPVAAGYGESGDVALMASNESPEPPLEAVVEAARRALLGTNRYPDPSASRLRAVLSDRFGLPASRIQIGNGSCEILLAAADALLEDGAEMVFAWPSFSIYPHMAEATGARQVRVPLDEHQCHDLDAMLAQITAATQIVIVCNPNNPTATALPLKQIADFIAAVPDHICVILDEAYCEYNTLDDPDASLPLLEKHPNLVLLRTFSKVYGLAGLRVGYALCGSDAFVAATTQVRQPFHTNAAAQAAAIAVLDYEDEIVRRVERAVAERIGLIEGLLELGIEATDSQTNFIWFDLPAGDADPAEVERGVLAGLAERGFQVRSGTALGRPGALRVSFGTPEQNRGFLEALGALVGDAAPAAR